MIKSQDFNKAVNEMFGAVPADLSVVQDFYKSGAVFGEKLSKVALAAAEQSTDISNKWTKAALANLAVASKAQEEPSDYAKAAADYATASVELAAENLAAFAEVAKKAQAETIELVLASGKEVTEEATAAVKKATAEVTAVTKKAAKAA